MSCPPPPHPLFLWKSAEPLEKKRVEFCVSAKNGKRVRKNKEAKEINEVKEIKEGRAAGRGCCREFTTNDTTDYPFCQILIKYLDGASCGIVRIGAQEKENKGVELTEGGQNGGRPRDEREVIFNLEDLRSHAAECEARA